MTDKYILIDKKPISEPHLLKWAKWVEKNDMRIARTEIENTVVSTIFLGLNYNFPLEGEPLLFETMIFHNNKIDLDFQETYSTYEEAIKGHNKAVKSEKKKLKEHRANLNTQTQQEPSK